VPKIWRAAMKSRSPRATRTHLRNTKVGQPKKRSGMSPRSRSYEKRRREKPQVSRQANIGGTPELQVRVIAKAGRKAEFLVARPCRSPL
jgi:hypothetical protein